VSAPVEPVPTLNDSKDLTVEPVEPPVLSRAALSKMIENIIADRTDEWDSEPVDDVIRYWMRKLADAILESLSQEAGQ
jgi:hypothetical protein